jgi:hypothetical protein
MCEHTPPPQSASPAPQPQTTEPRPRPRTLETHPLSGLEHLGRMTLQKLYTAVPTFREARAAGNTSDVDLDQQLLIELASDRSLPDVPPPNVLLSDVPLSHVPVPDVPSHDVVLPGACPDRFVGEELTSLPVAVVVIVVAPRLGSRSGLVCFLYSNLFISCIYYYTHCEVFGLLKICYIYGFCTGFILIGFM